jgi:hypothetical protein
MGSLSACPLMRSTCVRTSNKVTARAPINRPDTYQRSLKPREILSCEQQPVHTSPPFWGIRANRGRWRLSGFSHHRADDRNGGALRSFEHFSAAGSKRRSQTIRISGLKLAHRLRQITSVACPRNQFRRLFVITALLGRFFVCAERLRMPARLPWSSSETPLWLPLSSG